MLSLQLENQCSQLEGDKRELERRLKKLKEIKRDMERNFSDDISRISGRLQNAEASYDRGLTGDASHSHVIAGFSQIQEKKLGEDVYLNVVTLSIEAEISRCEREISSLEGQIKDTKARAKEAKRQENSSP